MNATTTNYFSLSELSCPCCGENKFSPLTLLRFNHLRVLVGEALIMSSGYRCPAYNKLIGATQTHETGHAGDLEVSHKLAYLVVYYATQVGFTGIGIKQKGAKRFIHLDDLEELLPKRPRPHIWSY